MLKKIKLTTGLLFAVTDINVGECAQCVLTLSINYFEILMHFYFCFQVIFPRYNATSQTSFAMTRRATAERVTSKKKIEDILQYHVRNFRFLKCVEI